METIVLRPVPDAESETRNAILQARVVAAAVLRPEQRLTVHDLAKTCGMTEGEVEESMQSGHILDHLQRVCDARVLAAVTRGVTVLDTIVNDKRASDRDRIAAVRTLVQAHQTNLLIQRKNDGKKGALLKDFNKAMKLMESWRQIGQSVDHEGTRTPPVASDPQAAIEDTGGTGTPGEPGN